MKTTHTLLLIASFSPAALLPSGCSKPDAGQPAAQNTMTAAKDIAADVKGAAADSWDRIKDYSYEKREDFAATLDRMAGKMDADIRAINVRFTGLPDAAAKERDHAVKEANEARAELESQLVFLRTGTADAWANTKQQATQAWQHLQTAYDKVKSSPTS
jgi:hypothetical protein